MLQLNSEHQHQRTLWSNRGIVLSRRDTHQPVVKTLTISVNRTTEMSRHLSLVRKFFSFLGTKTYAEKDLSAPAWWRIEAMDFHGHGLQPDHVRDAQAQSSHLVSLYMSCVQVMTSVRILPVSMSPH